jgi:hypothetical protein
MPFHSATHQRFFDSQVLALASISTHHTTIQPAPPQEEKGRSFKKLPSLKFDWGDEVFQPCQLPNESLPQLKPVERWRSQRKLPAETVALVTQLSLERLSMLRAQCKAWPDRISAVAYVPFVRNLGAVSAEVAAINGSSIADIASLIDTFHKEVEAEEGWCALDLELSIETFETTEDPALGLYPFNALRNRALTMAATDLVLLLDVDFLPSSDLPGSYQNNPLAFTELHEDLMNNRHALVLPAFQTIRNDSEGRNIASEVSRRGKSRVKSAWSEGELAGFQVAAYPPGHSPTKYDSWFKTTKRYRVGYEKGYEPYILLARRHVPFYDERFRGYSRDKIVHINHLAQQLKVALFVHPTAFVVHSPHRKAATFKATKVSGQWDRLFKLYLAVRHEIAAGKFVPVTSFARHCPLLVKPTLWGNYEPSKSPLGRKASSGG